MKHLDWDHAAPGVRLQLIKSAYDAHVLRAHRSTRSYQALHHSLEAGAYTFGAFKSVIDVCERYGFDGVDYIRAQFYFWHGPELVPPLGVMDSRKAMRNFQRWLDAQSDDPAYSSKQRYERAMRRSQYTVKRFMELNPEDFPDVKAVLRHPWVRQMLAKCYIESIEKPDPTL